jgi:hypothetical protein
MAQNGSTLLQIITNLGLYRKLVQQLQKDFQLSGINIELNQSITPDELTGILSDNIKKLMESNFDTYLQLLYRVDIAEDSMRSNQVEPVEELAEKATLSILQREWQKVYFRNKFG